MSGNSAISSRLNSLSQPSPQVEDFCFSQMSAPIRQYRRSNSVFTFIAAFICALRISFFNCETQLLNSLLLANVILSAIFYTFSNLPQLVAKLFYQSQLFQITLNLLVKVSTFGLQLLDFLHDSVNVDRFFFLERIYITRNVEIVVVLSHFLKCGKMTVLFYLLALTISVNNLLDMLRTELVLGLDLFKLLAGINEENVVILLTAFLEHQDTGRDACAIEDIGRKSDDGIHIVLLLDEETADYALGIATEQHAMRSDTSHCATLVEVVNHVENKGIVGSLAWCQASCLAETIIVVELIGSTPFGREWRICNDRIKLCIAKSISLQRVAIFYTEVTKFYAMKKHIHTSQVVGRRVLFLSENLVCMTDACCTEQQRTTTTSRVINIAQTSVTNGYYLCQDTAYFLRSVELTSFLASTSGKLRNHILVGITENINLLRCFHSELHIIKGKQHVAHQSVLIVRSLA